MQDFNHKPLWFKLGSFNRSRGLDLLPQARDGLHWTRLCATESDDDNDDVYMR